MQAMRFCGRFATFPKVTAECMQELRRQYEANIWPSAEAVLFRSLPYSILACTKEDEQNMKTAVIAERLEAPYEPANAPLLTLAQFKRERQYQVAMALLREMNVLGLLTQKELVQMDTMCARRFSPVWGNL